MLEKLGSSLREAIRKIAGASLVDEGLIKEVVRDIQRALLQSDVNVQLCLSLTRELERRALNEKPPAGMGPREHVIKIVYEELVRVLGEARELPLTKQRILLVGLYGQGKTTTAGKLARHLQKKGLSVGLLAGDTHRPAAYDQLLQIAEEIRVPFSGDPREGDARKVVKSGLRELASADVVIVDSSGRHNLEEELIAEIRDLSKIVRPDEVVLVLDATVGQQAGPQAKAFHDAAGVTSVILTKLDGSAKGGGALSAVAETKAPIIFVGTGEKLDDLERFDPPRFISRILGMGDLESLLEKAQESIDAERAEALAQKMLTGKFTLHDMYEQIDMVTNVGGMRKILGMLPGMPGKVRPEDADSTQVRLRRFKVIMDSMTEEEMTNPRLIKSSRVTRIARGSGATPREVRDLLKHFEMSRRAIKGFAGNRKMRKQLLKQLEASGIDLGEDDGGSRRRK